MRQLYQIDCGGAKYWVIAGSVGQALYLVSADESCKEEPHLDYPMTQSIARGLRHHVPGEDESCSLWFAYLIVREHAPCILACSEW